MSQSPQQPDSPPSLQGSEAPLATPEDRQRAVELAFDYRGDVTIHTQDGRVIEGYVFDRRRSNGQAVARVMTSDGQRVEIPYDQISRLIFSGRDPAAGKSWETWVRKYVEKKIRGQSASMDPDPLE